MHSEAHLDDFDQAFLKHFEGVEVEAKALKDELFDWLREAAERRHELTEEERALLEQFDLEELRRMFEERLREQDERHDGGNKWIGTGGTSPFGHSGKAAREGFRVGGPGGGRSAVKVADARRYRPYRSDLTLDVRQMAVALRKLRAFAREGGEEELDLEATIDETAKNAGELEIVTRPPRRPNTRVILMMDVGGSMDPVRPPGLAPLHAPRARRRTSRSSGPTTSTTASTATSTKTETFDDPSACSDVLADCGPHYKLIVVGDALMAPYELLHAGGALDLGEDTASKASSG